MSKPRILILDPDFDAAGAKAIRAALKDVHVSGFAEWEKGLAALAKEHFSVVVARRLNGARGAEECVRDVVALAPRTPLILVLPEKGGPSVLAALKGGAAEIIFEENADAELVPILEKYLFSGHG